MIIGARVIVVGKTYGPLSSGESQAEAWSESPGLERRFNRCTGITDGPTQSTREREDWSRGITQCCLLTLLNRQDVPERILYASVDLRPPDRPRKKTTLRRRSQGKVLASCLPTRAERDAEPHVLWMQGGVKWSDPHEGCHSPPLSVPREVRRRHCSRRR
eukprot:tig00000157_g9596.t1